MIGKEGTDEDDGRKRTMIKVKELTILRKHSEKCKCNAMIVQLIENELGNALIIVFDNLENTILLKNFVEMTDESDDDDEGEENDRDGYEELSPDSKTNY